jgi:D-glycerate 3-kinase
MLVGLAGPPGSGKSTLAHLVCTILGVDGREATVLSLDDYYLDSTQRASLAKDHPLLQQRGVPGTHDWGALIADVDKLRAGDLVTLRLPRFDKSRDEPAATGQFRTLNKQPAVVILEGWLVGAPAQHVSELTEPVNAMEAEADPDGRWRKWVNDHLASYHQALARRLDERWYLSAPDWETVVGWRWQQEQETASQAGQNHLASRGEVASFLHPPPVPPG